MKRAFGLLLLAAIAAPACAKKSPPAATASAEAVAALPPGAKMYVEVDIQAVMSVPIFKERIDAVLGEHPECAELVRSVTRAAIATYGEGLEGIPIIPQRRAVAFDSATGEEVPGPARDPKIVIRIDGAPTAALRGCLEKGAQTAGFEIRTETRGDRELFVGGPDGNLYGFAVSDTVHVLVVGESMLEATLTAAGGGASLAGDPVLDMLRNVPQGTVVAAMQFPPELAEEVLSGLKMMTGGKDIPAPLGAAISVTVGSDLAIVGALVMGDAAGASALKEVVDGLLSVARMGMSMAGADDPRVKMIKPIMDGIRIDVGGALLKATVTIPGSFLSEMAEQILAREREGSDRPRRRRVRDE
jgi:hypothetical protein